jgi:hypothetical protein
MYNEINMQQARPIASPSMLMPEKTGVFLRLLKAIFMLLTSIVLFFSIPGIGSLEPKGWCQYCAALSSAYKSML